MALEVYQPQPVQRLSLTQQEAAESLGVNVRTLQRWTKDKKIRHRKEGQVVLYPVDGIKEFLNGKN